MKTQVCCICGKVFRGPGNNPEPVMKPGWLYECCDRCNLQYVIPVRLKLTSTKWEDFKDDKKRTDQ